MQPSLRGQVRVAFLDHEVVVVGILMSFLSCECFGFGIYWSLAVVKVLSIARIDFLVM